MTDYAAGWDAAKAEALLGKRVVVGLTFQSAEGAINQHQIHGTISEAGLGSGIVIALEGTRAGETYRLPPDPNAFYHAPPGEYRLKTTGEVIVDPDFTSTWTIERSHPD